MQMEEWPAHPDIAGQLADILTPCLDQRRQDSQPVRARKSAQLEKKKIAIVAVLQIDSFIREKPSRAPMLFSVCPSNAEEETIFLGVGRGRRRLFCREECKQCDSDRCKGDNVPGAVMPVHSVGHGLRRLNRHRERMGKA